MIIIAFKSFIAHFRVLSIFFIMFLCVGNSQAKDTPLSVYAVNYPLKYFAESIAGENADVILPMPANIDPAFWSPKSKNVSQLQKADLILINGANYAKWLPKVSLPLSKLVNTSSTFRDAYINLQDEVKHNHGAGGEHSHAGIAFTTWLDFSLAELQAKAIFKVLSKKIPSSEGLLIKNYASLQQTLIGFDTEMSQIGTSLGGQALLGSHPVYQYLKKRYQLNLKSVHWEPEEAPSEEQWTHLQQIIKTHPAKWMLWEGQPAVETIKKLEKLGIKSIVFSPCSNKPETGSFLSVMRENINNIKLITQD